MKKLIITLIASLLLMSGMAQEKCSHVSLMDRQKAEDPTLPDRLRNMERDLQEYIELHQNRLAADAATIRIPVVFHVVYKNASENLPEARLTSQIEILNNDFRRLNADTSNTLAVFAPVAADVNVEFCLATEAPDGSVTSGIIRKTTTNNSFVSSNDSIYYDSKGGSDIWDAERYLNVYVCDVGGGGLGFAPYPGGDADEDGVVIDYDATGLGGSAPYNLGRTCTHEVGHWLNLIHIWGDGDCGVEDLVADTPDSDTSNTGCPLTHMSCGSLDMVQNYMDYSDDTCMNLFSAGQKTRMRAAIELSRAEFVTFSHLEVNGSPIPTDTYGSTIDLSSSGDIPLGNEVKFKTREKIILKPGFHALTGSKLETELTRCLCTDNAGGL